MIAIWFLPIYMAVISRACGGWFKIPGENFLYALPYALPVLAVQTTTDWYWTLLLAAVCAICATIGKGQANRVFMDLGTWAGTPRKPHNYEIAIGWLKPYLTAFQYDFVGLLLVGLAPALVPALIVGYFSPVAGLLLTAGGLYKPVAYFIGVTLWKAGALKTAATPWDEGTEWGEALTGLFAGVSIAACILVL